MLHHPYVECVKLFWVKRRIDRTPIHRVFGHLVAHDELVFRRPAGAIGVTDDSAVGGHPGFVPPDRVFDQLCWGEVKVCSPFAQQLGYVADVHGCSHWKFSWDDPQTAVEQKTFYSALNPRVLPRKRWRTAAIRQAKRYCKKLFCRIRSPRTDAKQLQKCCRCPGARSCTTRGRELGRASLRFCSRTPCGRDRNT